MFDKIKNNKLYVRTVDTGTTSGRIGLYFIEQDFLSDGILVSKTKHRTQPVQIFFNPILTEEEQHMLQQYFNLLIEYFRDKTDSEFLTTYRHSTHQYTRKRLCLTQVKELIQTFPIFSIDENNKVILNTLIHNRDQEGLLSFVKRVNCTDKLF